MAGKERSRMDEGAGSERRAAADGRTQERLIVFQKASREIAVYVH
jgi:hypothetical protein